MAYRHSTSVGSVFSRLTVIGEPFRRGKSNEWHVMCRCECGAEKPAMCGNLVRGLIKSCGCMRLEMTAQMGLANKRHGHASKIAGVTRTYESWTSAKRRCTDPTHDNYHIYGGRGIAMCDRWLNSFDNFLADMGERPVGTSIERNDVNGNYEPGNCRWATSAEQATNRQNSVWVEHNGVMKTTAQIAAEIGMDARTLVKRVRRGWPLDRAMSEPIRKAPLKAAA